MTITNYQKDGKILWKVYLNIRSKTDPTMREQKRIFDLPSEKAALAEEKRLYRELLDRLNQRAGLGLTWETVLGRWELAMRDDPSKPYVSTTILDNIGCMHKWTPDWLSRPASDLNKADGRAVLQRVKEYRKSKGYQRLSFIPTDPAVMEQLAVIVNGRGPK